jgi:hypothetical protein
MRRPTMYELKKAKVGDKLVLVLDKDSTNGTYVVLEVERKVLVCVGYGDGFPDTLTRVLKSTGKEEGRSSGVGRFYPLGHPVVVGIAKKEVLWERLEEMKVRVRDACRCDTIEG